MWLPPRHVHDDHDVHDGNYYYAHGDFSKHEINASDPSACVYLPFPAHHYQFQDLK